MYKWFFALMLIFSFARAEEEILSKNIVFRIIINAGITEVTLDHLKNAIEHSIEKQAKALLIILDTPGGLLSATREIVQIMLASKVPIIVYVSPKGARAGSAGLFVVLASSLAAMAPSTNIGAAHPVSIFGGETSDMKSKVENDTVAWARSLAEERGRNADFAEKAVRESASISSIEAKKMGVIELIAEDEASLMRMASEHTINFQGEKILLNIANAEVINFEKTSRQKLAEALSNPNLLYVLLLLGLLGLFIEFQSPGLIIPGLLGGLCLALVFFVQVLPINWLGAILIIAALLFFIVEIFIVSFGLLSIGGLLLLILGSYLLFEVEGSEFFVEPALIWIFSGFFAALILSVGFILYRAKRHGPKSNVDALSGLICLVTDEITPNKPGHVLLQGSYWQAHADEIIPEGEKVLVKRAEGVHVYVKKIS